MVERGDAGGHGLGRRRFLALSSVTTLAALLPGCGTDGAGEGDGEGSGNDDSSSNGEADTSSSVGDQSSDTSADGSTDGADASEPGTGESETGEPEPTPECGGTIVAFDAEAIARDPVAFPLAVLCGEMKPSSVMLAIYVGDAQPKRLRVWRPTEDAGTIELVYEAEVVPSEQGYAKLSVEGLCPGEWYRYAYFSGEDEAFTGRSDIGSFRTAIADDAEEPLVLALTACNGSSLQWPALDRMAEDYYDVFLHLGDMAYNDGAFTSEEFRQSWRQYLSAPGYRNALAKAGLYATWDDHEIDDNSNFDPETMAPDQLQKRINALDAYFEVLPIDAGGPDYRLWRSFRWGLTAEIIVLDCRYERRPSQGLYISPTQMQWLKERLRDSPCKFKIVMNSVPITAMPLVWGVASNDRWEGYALSRDDLLGFINDNAIDNVWFVSGDLHTNFVSRLNPNGTDRASNIREVAVTGGNQNPVPAFLLELVAPQFEYGVTQARGVLMTFDPIEETVSVRFIDPQTGVDDFAATWSA